MYRSLAIALFLIVFVGMCLGCKVANWRNMTMAERVYDSDIIVHGVDHHHENRTTNETADFTYVTDSTFHVYCVLKSDGQNVDGIIIIERVWPRTTCSVSDRYMELGKEVIVALKRTKSGNYEWDEVNVIQSAIFQATPENFATVANVCGSQNWTAPSGGSDQCKKATPLEPCLNFTTTDTSGQNPVGSMTSVAGFICIAFLSMFIMLIIN